MEIIRAKNSGFCFGVKSAMEKTYKAIEEREGSKNKGYNIYTCGQLIHNKGVTDRLEEKGVGIISKPSEAKENDVVIVRSHGEKEEFFIESNNLGLRVIDATCPFVKKIQILVKEAYEKGENILIVGDKNHPEVKGINGWCNNCASIVGKEEEAKALEKDSYFIVCQTTIKKSLLDDVLKILDDKNIGYTLKNTICNATTLRQEGCRDLAKNVDALIVIGDKNSSNSKKLYEIGKMYNKNTVFIEKFSDLPLKFCEKYNKIGIASGASTPECIIKEVIANMSETITKEKMSMEDYMDEIEASLRLPHIGETVNGKIHQVTDKEIIVNLGYKKDGILPVEEIILEEGQKLTDLYKEGDEIQAKVVKTDDGDGGIQLSKKKLEITKHWNEIAEALENKAILTVKVVRSVNGGVIANYKEVSGFIPLSQLSERYVETADEFIGKELEVYVTKLDQRKNRVVFSHKAVVSEAKKKQISAIWQALDVDDVVEGTVMRFTEYGAFVDIGGIDGLLHISEISWGKLKHPKEVLSIGEKVNVKILAMNEEKGKISLGLKQTTPEPWSIISDTYVVGQTVSGKVVQIKEYGAFIELQPGLDGLVHISEISKERVNDIADALTIGQEVEAKILDVDTDRKRISLSIKAALKPEVEEQATEA